MKRIIPLLFIPMITIYADRWTLVDFGTNLTSCITPYPGWTSILRHPTRTQFVNPDGNSAHDGITIAAGLNEGEYSYFGIQGSAPIAMAPGHEIICTLYNRSDYFPLPTVRISFNDSDVPDAGEPQYRWYTIYNKDININTDWVPPYSLIELRYYIQDESMLAAIDGVASTGSHSLINVNFAWFDSDEPPLVLTKIEYSNEADLTPPTKPANLHAEPFSTSSNAPATSVRLTWDPSSDPANASGVSRYYVYRNGALYDLVSQDMTEYLGTNLYYVDLGAQPGTTNTYTVAAIDKAQYGLYPRVGRDSTCHPANISPLSDPVTITTTVWQSSALLNPWTDFEYIGKFRLPYIVPTYDWSYASAGLTWYPHGNPGHNPNTHLRGCLYAYSTTQKGMGSFSIPIPVLSSSLTNLPRASTLIPVNTNLWPRIYNGSTFPEGGGDFPVAGAAYHPGGNGVSDRIYYCICNFYNTAPDVPSHGWFDLGLTQGNGAWHIGAAPPSSICPSITARSMCAIPQAWADAHTGGRSLLTCNNFLSGGPEIRTGPNLYAIAPWETGSLPGNGGVVSAVNMLQYGLLTTLSNRTYNWRIDNYSDGMAWLEVNGKTALLLSYRHPTGDSWYGDIAGNNFCFYNIPEAPAGGEGGGATSFRHDLMLYDPADLAAVIRGDLEPWEPQPYMTYDISQHSLITNVPDPQSGSLAFSSDGYLFFMEPNGDVDEMLGENAMIHVWRIKPQPAVAAMNLTGSELSFAWTTVSNNLYWLQETTNLMNAAGWTNITAPVTGDGTSKTGTWNIGGTPHSYYRLKMRSEE